MAECSEFQVIAAQTRMSSTEVNSKHSGHCICNFCSFVRVEKFFTVVGKFFQLANEKNIPQSELMKEATSILDEMAHTHNMKAVRGVAFFLIKVFKALFKRVYVSDEGLQTVRFAFDLNMLKY